MRQYLVPILMILAVVSCSKKENLMNVSGSIEGLKKGTIYLQRIVDTSLVTIDSTVVDGDSNFAFSTELESPEVFYLYLDKNDGTVFNDRIIFFGEVGDIVITTSRERFENDVEVTGSETHVKLKEYKDMISRFNKRNLEYLQAGFEAQKDSNLLKIDSIQRLIDKNVLSGYLYTLNFALTNKDSYVAPYVALAEAFDARIKYLDTIYNSLSPEIADSKYGKALADHIKKIKEEEKEAK
ncbi:DUF4369 domain-containing protein [Leptobacterium flavescens]|uniref:DUF4369 domain-containing protein n=1 Tax=Leptobacterium flavescens TaxID=472055 RepID=A0A6P0UPJ5_9FLAO|nr:DUF4369 domain-containing protein [Leptobacterium flavescens]NER12286.1 DUF4369 domain-containing protein [Leptobacterium flavescens]